MSQQMDKKTKALMVEWKASDEIKQGCADAVKQLFKPTKNPHAQALGRLGGKAGRGACKARSSDQARAAVAVRWNKVRETKQANSETTSTKGEAM